MDSRMIISLARNSLNNFDPSTSHLVGLGSGYKYTIGQKFRISVSDIDLRNFNSL